MRPLQRISALRLLQRISFIASIIALGGAIFSILNSFTFSQKSTAISYECGFIAAQDFYIHDRTGREPEENDFCRKYRMNMLSMGHVATPLQLVYRWSEKSL